MHVLEASGRYGGLETRPWKERQMWQTGKMDMEEDGGHEQNTLNEIL